MPIFPIFPMQKLEGKVLPHKTKGKKTLVMVSPKNPGNPIKTYYMSHRTGFAPNSPINSTSIMWGFSFLALIQATSTHSLSFHYLPGGHKRKKCCMSSAYL